METKLQTMMKIQAVEITKVVVKLVKRVEQKMKLEQEGVKQGIKGMK